MTEPVSEGELRLLRAVERDRVHSAYLIAGPRAAGSALALRFARALVCEAAQGRPCGACGPCRRSHETEPLALDGSGAKGPLYRHVGDHPDLLWVERGASDTRVRIGQVRALQQALRLRSHGSRRAAVLADAEWLNQEAQNALLRLLEEPPPATSIVLVAETASGLLATVRSRCQRIRLAPEAEVWLGPDAPEPAREIGERLDGIERATVSDLLDWAEGYRGARGPAAEGVELLLRVGAEWLRARVHAAAAGGTPQVEPELEAFRALSQARKGLSQRNANPQMVAERALFALRRATTR